MGVTISHNFEEVAARFEAAAAAIPALLEAELTPVAVALGEHGVGIIRHYTPIGMEPDDILNYEHLADTTDYDYLAQQSSVVIEYVQTKHVPMKRASGGDYPLWKLLTDGHDAPADPIFPVNKQALYWLGAANPVAWSPGGPAEPIPYIQNAVDALLPDVAGVLGNSGASVLRGAMEAGA